MIAVDVCFNQYIVESASSWAWEPNSKVHKKKFQSFLEYARDHPQKVKEINGVRFCCHSKFCIGHGSDGTRVFIGLGRDGYEKAVKRLYKDQCELLAKHEKQILNQTNTADSQHTVKYCWFDEESENEFSYIILELCEETLEEYVQRSSKEDLLTNAPNIISQILQGLVDLHKKPKQILHRDLKPTNIMRNVQDKWLLADFGISRILPEGKNTHASLARGHDHWRAAESYPSTKCPSRYKKESDIQTAGMVLFYIVTKGEHPFGSEVYRASNLVNGNPVGLSCIEDEAVKDLIEWMLSHNPEERPSAEEASKHPYLQTVHCQFDLLCTVGNLCEIKAGDISSDVVRQINSDTSDWRSLMNSDVYDYLCIDPKRATPNRYNNQWTDCLRFIRNANQHWKDAKSVPRPKAIECEPQDYFVNVFSNLPVRVHKIVRSCNWKEREEFRRFFS